MLLNHNIVWFISSGFEESILSLLNFRLNLASRAKDDYKDVPISRKVPISKKSLSMSYTDLYYDWLTISSRNNDFNTYHLYSSSKRVMI